MEENKKCPKCGGEMEKGVMATGLSANPYLKWGTKLKFPYLGDLEDSSTLTTYRCKACGYLESYAS